MKDKLLRVGAHVFWAWEEDTEPAVDETCGTCLRPYAEVRDGPAVRLQCHCLPSDELRTIEADVRALPAGTEIEFYLSSEGAFVRGGPFGLEWTRYEKKALPVDRAEALAKLAALPTFDETLLATTVAPENPEMAGDGEEVEVMNREELIIHGCWDCPCWHDDGAQCNLLEGPYQGVAHCADEPTPPPKDCPLRARSVIFKLEATPL